MFKTDYHPDCSISIARSLFRPHIPVVLEWKRVAEKSSYLAKRKLAVSWVRN